MKIKSREHLGRGPVYDIGLPEYHNFIIQGGLVASNCFNKSHSCSYSTLTYISAYLKANYPAQFFCALMSTRSKSLQPKSWASKAPEYIQEAKNLGVSISSPSINSSELEFSIKGTEVYFGLNAIRDVGSSAARAIVQARGKTPYSNIYDFLQRVNLRKVTTKTFISLVKAGTFDKLGYTRSSLLNNTNELFTYIKDIVEFEQRKLDIVIRDEENSKKTILIDKKKELQKVLKKEKRDPTSKEEEFLESVKTLRRLPSLKPKKVPVQPEIDRSSAIELSLEEIMEQAHYIGCYVGTHPAMLINTNAERLSTLYVGQSANICGVVNSVKEIKTKKGQQMAFLEIDDSTGVAEVVIFPGVWRKLEKSLITQGRLIELRVKVEQEEPNIKLIATSVIVYKE